MRVRGLERNDHVMPRCRARPCLVLLLAVFGALLCAAAEAAPIVHDYVPGTIATIFSTECNRCAPRSRRDSAERHD